jgi:hypothetical protein
MKFDIQIVQLPILEDCPREVGQVFAGYKGFGIRREPMVNMRIRE